MVDLKFGFNFEFIRDKSKDKIVDETKIEWTPVIKKEEENG
jgi:hypothetical protein